MSTLIQELEHDSPWFKSNAKGLMNHFDTQSPSAIPKKTELLSTKKDKDREMAQGAICISSWIEPLENYELFRDSEDVYYSGRDDDSEDKGDCLGGLLIYWQYRWPRRSHSQEKEEDATRPLGASYPANSVEIESAPEAYAKRPEEIHAEPRSKERGKQKSRQSTRPRHPLKNTPVDSEPSAHYKSKMQSPIPQHPEKSIHGSNVIIVYEKSKTNHLHRDTITLDSLSSALSYGTLFSDTTNVAEEAPRVSHSIDTIKSVIENVFESLAQDLDRKIDSHVARCGRLDRLVHGESEKDDITMKLWSCSKQNQGVRKTIDSTIYLMQDICRHFSKKGLGEEFLSRQLTKLRDFASDVEEDLRKPIVDMIDLVYKSISINDARRSMELNSSLWRLSWVTFIFLPLTFLVGFFGMNVDVFASNPAVQW